MTLSCNKTKLMKYIKNFINKSVKNVIKCNIRSVESYIISKYILLYRSKQNDRFKMLVNFCINYLAMYKKSLVINRIHDNSIIFYSFQ